MDTQEMFTLAQRMLAGPDTDARMRALVRLAPDGMLSRLGLEQRSSALGTALSMTGVFVGGAALGAGAALLLTPVTGEELQARIRKQAKRVSGDVKKAADRIDARVLDATARPKDAKSDGKPEESTHADGARA